MNERTNAGADPRPEPVEELRLDQPHKQTTQGPLTALQDPTLAVDLARADLDQQIATAHKYPRKIDVAIKKIAQLATFDEAAADRCVYALPRAGKPIVGPSIGLFDIVAANWGNCRVAARPLYVDRVAKLVYAEGAFLDLETNVTRQVSVSRRISDKSGRIYNDDMINVTMMAAIAIAQRNAVRRGVPEGIWFPIYERALYIVRGSENDLPERREKAIKALAHFGIDPAKILLFLDVKKIDEIGVEHMPTLRGMFTALKEDTVSAAELLDPRRMTGMAFEQVENPLGDDEDSDQGDGGDRSAAPGGVAGAVAPSPATSTNPANGAIGGQGGSAGASPAPTAVQQPGPQNNAPAAAPSQAAPPSGAKKGAAPLAGDDFATGDDYVEHVEMWLKGATSPAAVDNQYAGERKIRSRLADLGRITPAQLDEVKAMRDARKAALAGG